MKPKHGGSLLESRAGTEEPTGLEKQAQMSFVVGRAYCNIFSIQDYPRDRLRMNSCPYLWLPTGDQSD